MVRQRVDAQPLGLLHHPLGWDGMQAVQNGWVSGGGFVEVPPRGGGMGGLGWVGGGGWEGGGGGDGIMM